jgi:hypothetical protein
MRSFRYGTGMAQYSQGKEFIGIVREVVVRQYFLKKISGE